MTNPQKFLGTITLLSGAHKRGTGMCAMEAAAYLAGEPHSDHPECVSPVIASFMRSWNDGMRSDAERELLKPWVVKVLHTRTTAADEWTRGWLAFDWLVRVQTPAWLDLTPTLAPHATALRALPCLTSTEVYLASRQVLAAAWTAARTAARAAARAAAWDAARAAAWDAAWAAAGAAAWTAARAAAGAAAGAAAWDAAWDAAGEKLEPTVKALQASAFGLLGQMIAVGTPVEPVLQDRAVPTFHPGDLK